MRLRFLVHLCCTIGLGVTGAAASAASLRIQTLQDLSFGTFAAGSGGSVTLSTNGARSRSGGVSLMSSDTGQAAMFFVTGNNNTTYTISLPVSATLSKSGKTMKVNNFVSSPSANSASSGLLSGGYQIMYVGATLSVGASQSTGSYSGSFSVIVNNP